MPTPNPVAFLLPLLATAIAAQSTVASHGEVLLASLQHLPSSRGASPNDFPAAAILRVAGLGAAGTQPVIDGDGALLFRAVAGLNTNLGITAGNCEAMLHGRGAGDLRMLVRQDDPIPGLPATTRINGSSPFRQYQTSAFGGHLAIVVSLADAAVPSNTPTTADTAMLLGQAGNLQLLMREGATAPGLGGAFCGEMDVAGFAVNASGQVLVRNKLQIGPGGVTAANDGIVLLGSVGTLTPILREGSAWTGVGAAGEIVAAAPFLDVPIRGMRLLDDGRILHDVHFQVPSGTATSTANDTGLALWEGGVQRLLAREGQQAPGMPAGAVFADSGSVPFAVMVSGAIDKAGHVVFTSTFPTGPGGVTAADNQALFRHDGTSLSLLVRKGQPAPIGAGVTYGTIALTLQSNEAGQLLFSASLGGSVSSGDDSAVFLGAPGAPVAIAREGAAVPGLPGHVYGDLQPITMALNDRGQVLFLAPVVSGGTRNVMMEYTPEHGVRVFFDTANPLVLPLGTSTQTTIFGGNASPNSDGGLFMLNNLGDVGFVASCSGTEATTLGCAYMRSHVGSLYASPASVPATGGVPQQFAIDCGPANAGRFYFVLASSLGTRPGFLSPLGPQTIPLNFDPTWTNLSVSFVNTAVWSGTFGFTDASGRGVGPASFTLPTGVPGLAGLSLHHAVVLFDTSLVSTFVTEPAGLLLF